MECTSHSICTASESLLIWQLAMAQRRVLELLVEKITVSKERVEVRFRTNGIEQVAGELGPTGARSHD